LVSWKGKAKTAGSWQLAVGRKRFKNNCFAAFRIKKIENPAVAECLEHAPQLPGFFIFCI